MTRTWQWDKLLLVVALCATMCTGAGAAPDDALVVETVLLNALTSSSLVEDYKQTTESKETILFRVGKVGARETSSTLLGGTRAPFIGFPAETKEAFRQRGTGVRVPAFPSCYS